MKPLHPCIPRTPDKARATAPPACGPNRKPSVSQLDKKSQAWSALFSEPMSDLVKRYTASVFFDKRLWQAYSYYHRAP